MLQKALLLMDVFILVMCINVQNQKNYRGVHEIIRRIDNHHHKADHASQVTFHMTKLQANGSVNDSLNSFKLLDKKIMKIFTEYLDTLTLNCRNFPLI